MFRRILPAVGVGAMMLTLLACGGPTDAEVERAERVLRSRSVGADSAIRNCEAREEHIYSSFREAQRRAARVDPARAAAAVEQADRAQASAEQGLAEAERTRDEVEESGRRSMMAFERGQQFTVEMQTNPEELDEASRRVERARADAERAREQAARVRAEAAVAPPDEAGRARADDARERLSELQSLEARYGREFYELKSSLEEQVDNGDVMRVINKINNLLDDLEENMADIGCRK